MDKLDLRKQMIFTTLVLNLTTIFGTCSAASAHNSQVTTYRVAGWQAELVQASPNLGNFYWEPMTKRRINTTKRTGKQAETAPLPRRTIVVINRPTTASNTKITKQAIVASTARHSEVTCALSYNSHATQDVGLSALSVNAKLASGSEPKAQTSVKGLVASQRCMSLNSVH